MIHITSAIAKAIALYSASIVDRQYNGLFLGCPWNAISTKKDAEISSVTSCDGLFLIYHLLLFLMILTLLFLLHLTFPILLLLPYLSTKLENQLDKPNLLHFFKTIIYLPNPHHLLTFYLKCSPIIKLLLTNKDSFVKFQINMNHNITMKLSNMSVGRMLWMHKLRHLKQIKPGILLIFLFLRL